MSAKLIKISYPVPSNKNGHEFTSAEQLLSVLGGESSGQYLVGSQGMWHGGIHITDATVPWCALSGNTAAERDYLANRTPYKGEQFIRCMADGKIVAWRVCKDYDSTAIVWRNDNVFMSTSFVLVEHDVQPGEHESSGLTFHTLYMNMAPFAAYATEGGKNERRVAKSQRYYASAEDVQATPARPAGTLPASTAVTLSDAIISRDADRRQFTRVTLTADAKNAAGETLAAGTEVWTVSDQGSLQAASSAVPVPPWWAKCSPAPGAQGDAGVPCTARTSWQFYLSGEDVQQRKKAGELTAGFPLTYEPDNVAQQVTRPGKSEGEAARTFSLVTLGRDAGKMKKGDRVWVVSDGDSLTRTAPAAGGEATFGEVVIPAEPIAIGAGDGIGHMGFYELPEEGGKRSRYQVHIECLSMDDGLPAFLTNPDKVGEGSPAYLKYPEGATLYAKDAEGAMKDTGRVTRAPGILTLSGVPVIKADGAVTHYQVHPEGGWLAAASVTKLPQWSLGELGFVTLDRRPESFDLTGGNRPPDNVVKGILGEMYRAAKADPRTGSALNKYNYERLLKQMDKNGDGQFSEDEYLQAIQLPAYRDHLYRIIAKHPSEWWYGKDDPLWKTYLDTLTEDAATWKTYLETFIDRLTWMKQVAGMGPDPWHMHPVVFLDTITVSVDLITLDMLKVASPVANETYLANILPLMNKFAKKYNINSKFRIFHFLAQCAHESEFKIKEENLNYRAKRMREVYGCVKGMRNYISATDECRLGRLRDKLWTEENKYAMNAYNLGSYVYADRMGNDNENSGEGYKYRGRGIIQLTGKSQYIKINNLYKNKNPDTAVNIVSNPDLITSELNVGIEVAFLFWDLNSINSIADKDNIRDVTEAVNGGSNGLDDRAKRLHNLKERFL
ncbi:hypothetical protein ABEH87_16745 [Erwinia sp. Eh17-17]|uniref:hypothetical protein n=1 Tax=Erwinia sp. Eh17-17 TaxID=3080330 RepID=UPI0032082349